MNIATTEDKTHDGRSMTVARGFFRTEDGHEVVTVVELRHPHDSSVADVYVTTYAAHMARHGYWVQPSARDMRRMVAEVAEAVGMRHIHGLPRVESNFRALHTPHMMTSLTVGASYRYVVSI